MILIPNALRPSSIHGLGVFATRRVAKGRIVCRYVHGADRIYSPEQVSRFPFSVRRLFDDYYAINKRGEHSVSPDHTRFINHSNEPNISIEWIDGEPDVLSRALRDIKPGEEITCDYSLYLDVDTAEGANDFLLQHNERYMREIPVALRKEILSMYPRLLKGVL